MPYQEFSHFLQQFLPINLSKWEVKHPRKKAVHWWHLTNASLGNKGFPACNSEVNNKHQIYQCSKQILQQQETNSWLDSLFSTKTHKSAAVVLSWESAITLVGGSIWQTLYIPILPFIYLSWNTLKTKALLYMHTERWKSYLCSQGQSTIIVQ